MQNFDINNPQSANTRYAENIENTEPKNSNPVVPNTKTTTDYATRLSVQNPVGNAHNAVSHIVTGNTATSANGKNFLLRFFGHIGTLLKKIFFSFRAEKSAANPSEAPVPPAPNAPQIAPEQDINALNEPEALQEAVVPHNNKQLSFGELKQNLEKQLTELRALSDPDRGQINNLETRLFYLKKLDTMGSFLRLWFQTMSVSKYAKKGQIDDAKKNLKKLETLGIKGLEIPGGFEKAWENETNHRLLGALSSSTLNLDFKTFEKLYQKLQTDDCLSNKKFTDLMETTSKSTETARKNMATLANVFAMDGSKLGETLQKQLWKM